MKEEKEKERLEISKSTANVVASTDLEDSTPPPPPSHQKGKGDDYLKNKTIIEELFDSSSSSPLEEHGMTEPPLPSAIIPKKEMANKKNRLDSLGAQSNPSSQPTLIFSTEKENETSVVDKEALQLAPATEDEMPSPSMQIASNLKTSPSFITCQYNTAENSFVAESNREEQKEQEEEKDEERPQLFTVQDAFRVLTPEEQRQQRLEQQQQNMPLIEGQPIPSRLPSLTPSQQEAQQKKKKNRRLILLFFVCAFILVIISVPSLLLTNRNNNNGANSNLATISPSPSSNPSTSLMPSFSPSVSLVPSSYPTTSSPTSTTFNDLVALLGLNEEDSLSLDPNNYVFRSIQWMVEQDQVTRAVLLRQQTQGGQEAVLVQRFAVVCLYFATEGDSWFDRLGFLNPFTHECEWRVFGRLQNLPGATINCVDNVIASIVLNDNNLGGMIPSEISLLTGLTWLELQRNEIGGTLPSSLPRLSQLETLHLDSNKLTGSIPSELTTLNNLLVLYLRLNDLTGSIPESIGDLTNLQLLILWGNFLTGTIPSSIQSMRVLRQLTLPFNMLTSTLPTEINNLQQLEIYSVFSNLLTGTLPFEAGANPSLDIFDCGFNDLTRDVSRLTHLSSLTFLGFSFNKFTGTIPTEICNLSLLRFIHGASNILTGPLPNCLGDLTLLRYLVFANNSLIGSIPTLSTSLEVLALWKNQLTGQIPTGQFPNMTRLNLHINNFTNGTIPTELFTFTNLKVLNLAFCQLFGTIPTEIGLLTQLTRLDFINNTLFGTIPTEIGLLQNLDRLLLSVNSLTGTIPTEIGRLQNLDFLQLSLNRLTGTIPSEMGRLTSLRRLELNVNLLTGSLPSSFVNLPVQTLGRLALQANSLMGDVGFFCQDRTLGRFSADCQELTNCSCCTTCCDPGRSAIVDNMCLSNSFNNL